MLVAFSHALTLPSLRSSTSRCIRPASTYAHRQVTTPAPLAALSRNPARRPPRSRGFCSSRSSLTSAPQRSGPGHHARLMHLRATHGYRPVALHGSMARTAACGSSTCKARCAHVSTRMARRSSRPKSPSHLPAPDLLLRSGRCARAQAGAGAVAGTQSSRASTRSTRRRSRAAVMTGPCASVHSSSRQLPAPIGPEVASISSHCISCAQPARDVIGRVAERSRS